jgi:digeranylgeranylglycerophospholipid reductase
MLASFNVPDEVVMQFTDSVVLESPSEHYVREQPGAVLEFADFKRFLVEDGRERGAEYRFDARASAPITDDGQVVGVEYGGGETVRADVVVDATGPAAPLANDLGVVDLQRDHQAIGVEYEYEGLALDAEGYADLEDAMMLRLDHDIAPGGYAWIFHTGDDTAKVGLCYIQNESHERYAVAGQTIDGYIEQWVEEDPRFDGAEKIAGKQHRGSAHIQLPSGFSTDGFLAVGDTVPTIDPLWGEGIHKGMKSARAAAIAVDYAMTPRHREPDTDAETLSLYDDLWREEVAPKMKTRLLMTELLYMADNGRYDDLMRTLRGADDDTLEAANAGSKRAILKLLQPGDVSTLGRLARRRLGA